MAKKHNSYFNTQFNTTCISTTLVLILLGTIVLFIHSTQNFSNYVRENINISILINDEMDSLSIQNLKRNFEKAEYVKSLKYISKEQALQEEIKELGADPTELLDTNPFTASFEINVKAEYANNTYMDKTVRNIKKTPGVLDVIYSKGLIKTVNDWISKISIILLIMAALFTYISFALINNTVLLTIFSKRFTINTMKLVGASWGFIRRPFLVRGAVLGFSSAALAIAFICIGVQWLIRYNPELNTIIDWKVLTSVGVSVFIFGMAISMFCTIISLNKYLKMDTNKLYYI